MELVDLARFHLKAFRYSRGLPVRHQEYLIEAFNKGRVSLDDLKVSGDALVFDAEAGDKLITAMEKQHEGRYHYYSGIGVLKEVIAAQIEKPRQNALDRILAQLSAR